MSFLPARIADVSNRTLAITAFLLALATAWMALFWNPSFPERPLPAPGLPPGGDFTLHTADGALALRDFRGKAVLLHFGCIRCGDDSPAVLRTAADAIEQLEPGEKERLVVLFVSVDPERDTPQRLSQYVEPFGGGITGATGNSAQIADMASRYGVLHERQPADGNGDYIVNHSMDSYLIGRSGRIVERISHGMPPVRLAQAIRKSLSSE